MRIFTFTFRVMGGPAEVQLVGRGTEEVEPVAAALEGECKRIERKFSRYDQSSALSAINAMAGVSSVHVDDEVSALLDYADACYAQSDGLFDVTSGVLRQVWDFRSGRPPTSAEIAKILPLIGWEKVQWNKPTLFLPLGGMQLDFGGLGKEYAVDRCVAMALERKVPGGLVNLAGDVRVFGTHPAGKPWRIGIVHPREPDKIIASVEVQDSAVATSGDYERFMVIEGKRYCHILNPRTGMPAHAAQSVTVVASSCLIAGTATTVAMLLPEPLLKQYLKNLKLPNIVITESGRVEHAGVALAF